MPLSPGFYQQALARLSEARPVTARKMFGGGGIYYNDIFFALLDDDRVFFKVDAETVGEYEARGCGPWVCAGEVSPNYRELPAEIWNDPERLGDWIEAAALAAKRLKSKRRA